MASIANDPRGFRRVLFIGIDGKRRTIRLGKVSQKIADAVARHVENILSAALHPPLAKETAAWLADQPDRFYDKLVRAGLVIPREKSADAPVARLGEHVDAYFSKRTDMKPASRLVLGHVVRNLKDYFGEDRDLRTITPGDADDFSRWLMTGARKRGKADKSKGLSPATIGKRLQWCSAIFRDAVRRKLIPENPFSGLKQPKATNPARKVYVPAETIEKVIETTADDEWKLLLALARYLGLRIPSEAFSLTWDCIDWERGRIRIPSPKTDVHGKPFRVAPLLPEIRPHLDRLFFAENEYPDRSVYVLSRLRSRGSVQAAERGFWANMNLRQQLLRLLTRAGVKPWPKLWHNLRASAQTDLAGRFPIHVVCEWIGNTEAIARDHYLQVTDADFEAALKPSKKAAQKAAHSATESMRLDAHPCPTNEKTPCFQGVRPEGMECSALRSNRRNLASETGHHPDFITRISQRFRHANLASGGYLRRESLSSLCYSGVVTSRTRVSF